MLAMMVAPLFGWSRSRSDFPLVRGDTQTVYQGGFRNSVFIEAGGSCTQFFINRLYLWLRFSVNYERLIYERPNLNVTARIGSNMPLGNFDSNKPDHLMVAMLLAQFGHRPTKFEIGFGALFTYRHRDYSCLYADETASIGVRYHRENSRFLFRLTWSGIYFEDRSVQLFAKLGISAGYMLGSK